MSSVWLIILKERKELVNPQSLWSAVLFMREERLRLECESRVSLSKWEAREGWKVKNVYTAEYMYEYFYTCKESSLLEFITCQDVEKGFIAKYKFSRKTEARFSKDPVS